MKEECLEERRRLLPSLKVSTVLILVGVVIGVVGVFVIGILSEPTTEELEAIKLQDTANYINAEQGRLGINCNELNSTIRNFLEKHVTPILDVHQPGRNWYKDINADMREQVKKLRYSYSDCERLYSQAQQAGWDGLQGFKYTPGLETQLAILNTLIRYEFCGAHDVKCLDEGFRDLQEAATKIETALVMADAKKTGVKLNQPENKTTQNHGARGPELRVRSFIITSPIPYTAHGTPFKA